MTVCTNGAGFRTAIFRSRRPCPWVYPTSTIAKIAPTTANTKKSAHFRNIGFLQSDETLIRPKLTDQRVFDNYPHQNESELIRVFDIRHSLFGIRNSFSQCRMSNKEFPILRERHHSPTHHSPLTYSPLTTHHSPTHHSPPPVQCQP